MKSLKEEVFPESVFMITPSEVIEYLYCPRFIYFMNCLNIAQHEELRYKVIKGRNIHKERSIRNRDYLRKKLGCVNKDINAYLASPNLHIRGIVDEVLHLGDGTLAPLDYKFSEYKEQIFQTYKMQSILYAMLVQEAYQKPVKRGFVCFLRSNSRVKEIVYTEKDFDHARSTVAKICDIIVKGYYPGKTRWRARCTDCCYKNICV